MVVQVEVVETDIVDEDDEVGMTEYVTVSQSLSPLVCLLLTLVDCLF